jgi:hypothetical protein
MKVSAIPVWVAPHAPAPDEPRDNPPKQNFTYTDAHRRRICTVSPREP